MALSEHHNLRTFLSPIGAPSLTRSLAVRRSLLRWQKIQEMASRNAAGTFAWVASTLEELSVEQRQVVLDSPDCGLLVRRAGCDQEGLEAEISAIGEIAQFLRSDVEFHLPASGTLSFAWQPFGSVLLKGNGAEVRVSSLAFRAGVLVLLDAESAMVASYPVQAQPESSHSGVRKRASPGSSAWEIANGWSSYRDDFDDGNASVLLSEAEETALFIELQAAWRLVGTVCPRVMAEMQHTARYLSPIRPIHGSKAPSFSSSALPGVIFIGTHNSEGNLYPFDLLAEACLHEHLHNRLYLLDESVPLAKPTEPPRTYYSPWKQTARPVDGMLHAIYVFANLAWFWRAIAGRVNTGIPHNLAVERSEAHALPLQAALKTLEGTEELTPAGEAVIREASEISRSLGFC